ncbi:MAG TPA: hypothetical protein VLJ59_00585 [Mycobacteriales bacterium]|nr:hypothetical protein [Mycobacteriales bacterium]
MAHRAALRMSAFAALAAVVGATAVGSAHGGDRSQPDRAAASPAAGAGAPLAGSGMSVLGDEIEAGTATVRPAAVSAACADRAYSLEGFQAAKTLTFCYNPAGSPTNVRTATATKNATWTVTIGANRCGITRRLAASGGYAGTTGRVRPGGHRGQV